MRGLFPTTDPDIIHGTLNPEIQFTDAGWARAYDISVARLNYQNSPEHAQLVAVDLAEAVAAGTAGMCGSCDKVRHYAHETICEICWYMPYYSNQVAAALGLSTDCPKCDQYIQPFDLDLYGQCRGCENKRQDEIRAVATEEQETQ